MRVADYNPERQALRIKGFAQMFTGLSRIFSAATKSHPRGWAFAPLLALGSLLAVAEAEVTNAKPQGFIVTSEARIAAPPSEVYAALVSDIGHWWHPAHTFSGDAGNLSIDARAGGCFCERLAREGSVQHMEIVFAAPGKLLRMRGGLGPLQGLAVAGSMDWQLHEEESGTRLELRYSVGGYLPDGLDAWARPVDSVLVEQLGRLKEYIETGSPEADKPNDDGS